MLANDQFLKVAISLVMLLFSLMFFIVGYQSWVIPWRRLEVKGLLDPTVAKIMYWLPAGCILFAIIAERPFFLDLNIMGSSFTYEIPFSILVILCIIGIGLIGIITALVYCHIQIVTKRKIEPALYPFWWLVLFLIVTIYWGKHLFYQ
jgi:hypothetical protein